MSLRKSPNYLDFIPTKNPKNSWSEDENGKVTVHMVHRGFYAAIAQKFFHRPRVRFGRIWKFYLEKDRRREKRWSAGPGAEGTFWSGGRTPV